MTLIGTKAAGKLIGRDPARIRQLIAEGTLPAQRVGRDHLIDPRDLKRLVLRPRGRKPRIRTRK
jgi:hypothetical protein